MSSLRALVMRIVLMSQSSFYKGRAKYGMVGQLVDEFCERIVTLCEAEKDAKKREALIKSIEKLCEQVSAVDALTFSAQANVKGVLQVLKVTL